MSKKSIKIILLALLTLIIVSGGLGAFYVYKQLSKPIIDLHGAESIVIFIPTGSQFEDVESILMEKSILIDTTLFNILAERKRYKSHVKAGRYILSNHMTGNALINKLRSGNQSPIRFTFNNIRFVDKLAGLAARKLELDSSELSRLFHNDVYLEQFGFNQQTVVAMFLPNTYEFYWNTSADQFMKRMHSEYLKFWNGARKNKALAMNLSIQDVSVLASIVQEETNKKDEMSAIAGVYVNRLDRGMLLQADPTARFAYGDFSVKRVLYDYLKIDSPYNTYVYPGLPPGPICMPSPITIDKVLDYEKHKYIFFCARPDNSGYHAFAVTNSEHNRNARAYHRYLRKHRIR